MVSVLSATPPFLYIDVQGGEDAGLGMSLMSIDLQAQLSMGQTPPEESPLFGLTLSQLAFMDDEPTAMSAAAALGAGIYGQLYSFSLVRNPFAVMVAAYAAALDEQGYRPTPEGFAYLHMDMAHEAPQAFQREMLCGPDGEMMVSDVYRFEELSNGMATLRQRLGGVPEATMLLQTPLAGIDSPWIEFYSPDVFAAVAGVVADEAEFFGYSTRYEDYK